MSEKSISKTSTEFNSFKRIKELKIEFCEKNLTQKKKKMFETIFQKKERNQKKNLFPYGGES